VAVQNTHRPHRCKPTFPKKAAPCQQVYKQHGVRSLPDLLRKHGHAIAPPATHDVRRRLLAGQSIAQIAAETGAGKTLIYNQRQALRKAGEKLRDGREHNGGKQSTLRSLRKARKVFVPHAR
jgi:hypothetical protein